MKNLSLVVLPVLLTSLFAPSFAHGAVVPIVNADFETVWDNNVNQNQQAITPAAYATGFGAQLVTYFDEGDGAGTGPANAYFPGWTTLGPAASQGVEYLQLNSATGPFFNAGEQTGFGAYMNAPGAGSSGVEQVLAANLLPATIYTLSLDIGKRLEFGNGWNASNYSVELFAGATSLSLTGTDPNPTAGNFDHATYTYVSPLAGAIIGQALTIRVSNTGGGNQLIFDNVLLDASPIPEPSTMLLLGVGGLLLWRKKGSR